MENDVTLVVITGQSGAGKSEAIAAFEDGGYFCDLLHVLDELEVDGLKTKVLFLEADEETLVDRYKETRRRHPMAPDRSVTEGIRAERELLGPLRERADVVMSTSDLTGAMLRRRIGEELLGRDEGPKLALTLLTFGFKNGPPRDSDLTLDVRFLPNPHYVDELLPLLEFLVPAYVAEGKSHLTLAIGCTGGRHRSVTVADRIRRDLEGRDDVAVRVKHRDAE